MNKRLFKVTVILILSFALLICSTASFAKYSKTDTVQAEVATRKQFYSRTYDDQPSGDYLEFEAQYDGYYAIILKGGNGGNGNKGTNTSFTTRKTGEGQTGGYGGVMYGIFSTEDIRYLRIALGSAGTDATGSQTKGIAGKSTTNTVPLLNTALKGADGNYYWSSSGTRAGSGGSGAASAVYAYPAVPVSYEGISLGIIAGGGGSSGGWDTAKSKTSPAGFGGSGGSNYKTTENNVAISEGTPYSVSNGKVYKGFNGTELTSGMQTFGKGGSITFASNGGGTGTLGTTGTSGQNYISGDGGLPGNNSGNGAAPGNTCGGAGGGGYAGGGSGGWRNAGTYVGGGGGGSSFISTEMSIDEYQNPVLLSEIYNYMHEHAGYNPLDATQTKNNDGYVIIMYLGSLEPKNLSLLNDPTSEFYYGHFTTTAPIHVTAKNTGYYAIIAKGADGGNGYQYNGNSGGIKKNYYGGVGGITSSYAYVTAGSTFNIYLGSPGGTPVPTGGSTRTAEGTAGTNGASIGLGGLGSNYSSGDGSNMTMNIASGGGGAATVVYLGNTSSTANILAIAGGGGGAASWDEGMNGYLGVLTTRPCGGGGAGATNAPGNTLSQASTNVSSGNFVGKVISGSNGLVDNSYANPSNDEFGSGGYTSGGAGGKSSLITWLIQNIYSQTGEAGKNAANNGTGGAGALHGGGGGGGYCGGGGGSGTSINYSAGGGGGGSSYIRTGTNQGVLSNATVFNEVISRSGANLNDTKGFYVIAFIGDTAPT